MARLKFLKKKRHSQEQEDSASTGSSTRSSSRKQKQAQESTFEEQYPASSSPASSPGQSITKPMPSITRSSPPPPQPMLQSRSPQMFQRSPQAQRSPQPIQAHRAQFGHVANSVTVPPSATSPWNRFKLFDSPFPRYRHAAASISSEKNEIFLMGGLKEGSVFGDTWKLVPMENHQGEVVNFTAKNLEILNHINPPARVGHSAVLCGNAFVIYGGDTVDTDANGFPDNNFYLFNTNNCKYTIPTHILNKPNGRYGHTIGVVSLTNSSSRLYLFGGQLENDVFNDLYYFELNSFKSLQASWELVEPANNFKPPPLTNHSMSIYQNQIYIFGGIYNNELVSSDLWIFNVEHNKWSKIDTSGYVPKPVNEHSSCIVNDKLYIYGGNDFKGIIYSSLYVLDLNTFVWSKLIDMGEINGPGPRCGHSMTFLPRYNKIIVMGGDKNDYVDNSDNFEMYEEYRENVVGTMIFQLDLNEIDHFLISDPNKATVDKRIATRSMSALEEDYDASLQSPPNITRESQEPPTIKELPEPVSRESSVGVIKESSFDHLKDREPSFVDVPAAEVHHESIKDVSVKKVIAELNSEIQQLRKSTKEQMEIATEKITFLENENKSLKDSNRDFDYYQKQINNKDQLIEELKGNIKPEDESVTKFKLDSLESNNKLIYVTQENNKLKEKLEQFEPFMNNHIMELDKFQKLIKNQEDKISQLTNQIKSEESLHKEINDWKAKFDNLSLEFNNYKLAHDDSEEEIMENGDDDATTETTRSVSSKKDISNQLENLIHLWNVKKTPEPTPEENPTVAQLQRQVDELLRISKENDQSTEVETLHKQLEEKTVALEKFEENYKQALQSVNNTSKALKLNEEEFEHQKKLLEKLTKENNELKLFKKASKRISSRSGTPDELTEESNEADDDDDEGISNAHLNIKIKDLEADLYIIRQERDQLKDHVISLQKELYLVKNEHH